MNSNNPLSYSVYWTDEQNKNGTKPQNPQFIKKEAPEYLQVLTSLPSAYTQIDNPVGLIQSKREPYAVENMYTSYGQLNTRLGTNMGN
jgi:hypothetical protein